MITWLAVAGVALGSYLFRAAPIMLPGRATGGARGHRLAALAGLSAIVALVASSVNHHFSSKGAAGGFGAVAAIAVAGLLGRDHRSLALAVGAGLGVYAAVAAVPGLLT